MENLTRLTWRIEPISPDPLGPKFLSHVATDHAFRSGASSLAKLAYGRDEGLELGQEDVVRAAKAKSRIDRIVFDRFLDLTVCQIPDLVRGRAQCRVDLACVESSLIGDRANDDWNIDNFSCLIEMVHTICECDAVDHWHECIVYTKCDSFEQSGNRQYRFTRDLAAPVILPLGCLVFRKCIIGGHDSARGHGLEAVELGLSFGAVKQLEEDSITVGQFFYSEHWRALHRTSDRLLEQALRVTIVQRQLGHYGQASSRLTHNRNVVGVSTKSVDVIFDPLHSKSLIEQACVSRRKIFVCHEPECTETIADAYSDEVLALTCPIAQVVVGRLTILQTTTLWKTMYKSALLVGFP